MFVTFTRFSVKDGAQFVSVRPVLVDGRFMGRTTRLGALIEISLSDSVITASEHGTLASATKTGSVHSISASLVTKAETLGQLLKRNPWDNENASILRKGLRKQSQSQG